MTNAKKFEEVFGFKPDIDICVLNECESDCRYRPHNETFCDCRAWWLEDYISTKNEKIADV